LAKLAKLHRSQNNRMVAGVMGGIAEYVGWSPMWVRILFVVISSLSAAMPGILIYIILWVIMPNASDQSRE
jgi:phage shock protein C